MHETGLKVCPECWDPDQPQLQVGRWPVSDPQALRSPRPAGESGGREDGWLVFDYDNLDNWKTHHGQVYRNPQNKTIIFAASNELSKSPGFHTDDVSIEAAYYRWARLRFRVLEWPEPSWGVEATLAPNVVALWRFSRPYGLDNRPSDVQFANSGNEIHDWYWDFSKEALPASPPIDQEPYPWNEVVDRCRIHIFKLATKATDPDYVAQSFKIEIFDLSFIPQRVQPPIDTRYGIVNWDFSSPEFNRGRAGNRTRNNEGADSVPGWLATPAPLLPTDSQPGYIGGIGVSEMASDLSGVNHLGKRVYMFPHYVPSQVSQLTTTSIAPDTEYTVSADFYRNTGVPATEYCLRLRSGSRLLSSSSSPVPAEGHGVTSTASFTAGASEVFDGPIEVEVENSAPPFQVVGETRTCSFGNVRLSSRSASSYKWDFKDGTDGFSAVNGTVTHDPAGTIRLTSLGNVGDDFSVRLRRDNLSGILAANVMKMRMMCRVLTAPAATYLGMLKYKRHWGWQTFSPLAPDPGFSQNPDQWMVLEWDMPGSADGWTQALSSFEWVLWQSGDGNGTPVDSVGVIEIDWISLEKYPKDPDVETSFGVKNPDFALPVLWDPAITTYQHFGNTTTAVPGWVCDESVDPVGAPSEGNVGVHNFNSPTIDLPSFERGVHISAQTDVPIGLTQSLGKVIEANTRYTFQFDVGRRLSATLPVSYKGSIRAGGVEIVSTDTLYQEQKVSPAAGESATTGCTFRTFNDDAYIGDEMEIRLENSATDITVNGPVAFDNVKFFSEPVPNVQPVVKYDFSLGTPTLTSPASLGNNYGIEGWAYFDSGQHPASGSLTVPTAGLVSLNTESDWDNPLFTYWDVPSPGVKASVPTGEVNFVRMQIRRTTEGSVGFKEWKGRFYWVSQDREQEGLYPFADYAEIGEPEFDSSTGFEILTWEVGNNPRWREEGTATGFRIDLYEYSGSGTRDVFEISYIWFLDKHQGF